MTTEVTTSVTMVGDSDVWESFVTGPWTGDIDARDFIQHNCSPCDGDASSLTDAMSRTPRLWDTLEKDCLPERRRVRILDVDTHTPADIDAFLAGYISENDDVITGLQTDSPLHCVVMPNGDWRMAETAIEEAGKGVDPRAKKIFARYHETRNDVVFDIYTPCIRATRSSHIITGLPDVYGRGRIIGDYRRMALYGADFLIEQKQKTKDAVADKSFSKHWACYREGYSKQIRALKKLKTMAASHGYDVSGLAKSAHGAVQWAYFAYLASVKSQDSAAMNIGHLSAFLDIYFEWDLHNEVIDETHVQELIDDTVMKLRITYFLRTIGYGQTFSGDPYWATWFDADFGEDGRTLVIKTSSRLLQTLHNLDPAPRSNITIFWDESPPQSYGDFCTFISITTSPIQYETDKQIREHQDDNTMTACCASPMHVGRQIQFFGARVDSAKALLYVISNGCDEMTDRRVVTGLPDVEGDNPLDSGEVRDEYEKVLDWAVTIYVEALNIIHYCHDRYAYKSTKMAPHDSDIVRTVGCGITDLSTMADSLAAIKYIKVIPVRDKIGLVVGYVTEGDFPIYGNDSDHIDGIAATAAHTIISKIKIQPFYHGAIPTQSVLTITSNMAHGKATGSFPSGHQRDTPFSPGANPENGMDTHGMVASMLGVGKLGYSNALNGTSLASTITLQGLGHTFGERVANLVGILDAGFVPDNCVGI